MAWALQAGTCKRYVNVFYQVCFITSVCLSTEANLQKQKTKALSQGKHGIHRVFPQCFIYCTPFQNLLSGFLLKLSPLSSDECCSDDDVSNCPRGCSPSTLHSEAQSVSPSIPIPTQRGLSCSPHGTLVFSSSPTSSLPPLPCGSAPRRNPSVKNDTGISQGSLRLSHSNRNSATSLLSMSTCSDTSYILGR